MPTELDELNRRVLQLEIEREALKRETDEKSRDRLAKLEKELADQKEERDELMRQWESEKAGIEGVRKIKEAIEKTRLEVEEAERTLDYNKAAELRYSKLHSLEKHVITSYSIHYTKLYEGWPSGSQPWAASSCFSRECSLE